MDKQSSSLAHIALSVVASITAVAYVAPLPQPTVYAVLVKCLPCLSLFYYIWKTQISKYHNTSGKALLTILGLGTETPKASLKQKDGKGKSRSGNIAEKVELQRNLTVRTTRGLLMSMVGDAFMVWHNEETAFLLGMAAFGIAQLCYIHGLGFVRIHVWRGVVISGLLAAIAFVLLAEAPPIFQMLVPCYAVLLGTTLWRAMDRCCVEDGRPAWQKRAMVAGALVFVVSDTCIAVFKFVLRVPPTAAEAVVLSTYFAAQTLLVVGAT